MKLYIVALLVVVGVLGGFYGGYKVGQNNVSAASPAAGSSQRGGGTAGGFGGGTRGNFAAACPSPGAPSPSPGSNAVARGTITDLSSSSLTITNPACDVKIEFGNTVQVSKTVPGSTSDLMNNMMVTIVGTRQADGSIKASVIQIGSVIAIGGGTRGSGGGTGGG